MKRLELKRLIRDIEAGEINMLMVSELSCLTRSNKDFAELWEFLQANRCGFMSLTLKDGAPCASSRRTGIFQRKRADA